ncbi:ribonuclease-domain-containing protein [Trichocladium antarcticum]|uniref:ribonuclease T1 n=1 Tax=Trichocladium antarcticum TaxID=1450529 RepID=A0AAN6Z9C6_9PEZI|nr:ribonuclease-domain-containing protein [Trichocladium antarcticum]
MVHLIPTLALALYAVLATADAAGPALDRRQGTASLGSVMCGTHSYTKAQIDAAVAEGCRLHRAGEQLGTSKYPHRFNNREGLVFATSGPYQEFPVLESGVYAGRAPGADRIVVDPNYQGDCVFVGAMTHTDAPTRNGFVACSVRSSPRPSTSSSGTAAATETPNAGARLAGMGGGGLVAGVLGCLLAL